jgi:hypothetical protein
MANPRPGPKPETIARARALGLTVPELFKMRQQVSCALANLGEFRLYFSRKHRCVIARSTHVARHFRVPPGAVEVGVYAADTIKARDILGDLAEVIQRTRRARRIAPPAGDAGACCAIEASPMPSPAPARPKPWSAFFRAKPAG